MQPSSTCTTLHVSLGDGAGDEVEGGAGGVVVSALELGGGGLLLLDAGAAGVVRGAEVDGCGLLLVLVGAGGFFVGGGVLLPTAVGAPGLAGGM